MENEMFSLDLFTIISGGWREISPVNMGLRARTVSLF